MWRSTVFFQKQEILFEQFSKFSTSLGRGGAMHLPQRGGWTVSEGGFVTILKHFEERKSSDRIAG